MSQTFDEEIRTLRTHYWSARDPDGRAFAPLAEIYRRKGELDEAGSLVRDGLGRLPEFATGHLVAARVSRDRGDLVEARGHLDRVLDLDPENVVALLERADLAGSEGDREQALADLQTLLELEPGHTEARGALEELEHSSVWHSGDPEGESEATAGGTDAPAGGLGVTALGASETAEIESTWDADPFDIEPAPIEPAGSFGEDTELEEAGAESGPFEPEVEDRSEPDDRSMFTRTMGEIYVRQGFLDRAVEVYTHLCARAPADSDLRARLEELEAELGESDASDRPVGPGPEPTSFPSDPVPVENGEPGLAVRTIGDYFDDLLAWVPGAVPIETLAPDAVPIESLAPDVVEVESLAPDADEMVGADAESAAGPSRKTDASGSAVDETDDASDDDFDEFQSWLESLQT